MRSALQMNVTIANPNADGFLTIWPTDEHQPNAASQNWVAGQPPTPNAVTTKLSYFGQFAMFINAGTAEVIVDISGYFADHHHDDRYYTKTQIGGVFDYDTGSIQLPAGTYTSGTINCPFGTPRRGHRQQHHRVHQFRQDVRHVRRLLPEQSVVGARRGFGTGDLRAGHRWLLRGELRTERRRWPLLTRGRVGPTAGAARDRRYGRPASRPGSADRHVHARGRCHNWPTRRGRST